MVSRSGAGQGDRLRTECAAPSRPPALPAECTMSPMLCLQGLGHTHLESSSCGGLESVTLLPNLGSPAPSPEDSGRREPKGAP